MADDQGQNLTRAVACEQPRYQEAGSGQPRCREAAGKEPRKRAAATEKGDLTRLACLWSQQELCGRRPAKYDPFKWACRERNVDSFLLYVRLKRLPKVPTFAEAVAQQRQVTDDEAKARETRHCTDSLDGKKSQDARPQDPPFSDDVNDGAPARSYNMFDDDEGEDWQNEPDDW